MKRNFKTLLRREAEVAFSPKTQRPWIRIIKYCVLVFLIYLFHGSKTFWIIFGVVCVLALVVHFWTRYKTAGWTKSWACGNMKKAKSANANALKTFLVSCIITTERLCLRRWKEEDFAPFAAMNSNEDVMRYFPNTFSDDETAAMMGRIQTHFKTHGFGLFALEKLNTKTFIGFTGFMVPKFESFFTPCIEIGWRIKKEEWNKGYATEAAAACLQYGFETLGFDKIYSFTSAINHPSEKVMQKIGLKKEGEFNHPAIAAGSPLRRHVLYKIEKSQTI